MGQDATLEILAEILLDVGGNRETLIILLPATGQPGFQMALHRRVNRGTLRLPAPINRCARNALLLALATACRSHDPIRE